jgi:Pregnancy-associated plasma protein-A
VLNVYQCDFLGAMGYAGVGSYPVGVQYPTYSYLDGVTIFNPFVRSGSGSGIDSVVTTLVHEVGHWLGLKHTFSKNNSCDGDGDNIAGTSCRPSCVFLLDSSPHAYADIRLHISLHTI